MAGKGNPMFGCRIPPEWLHEFEQLSQATGKKPADLAREAFAAYLGKNSDSSAISEIEALANRVAALEKKFQGQASVSS